MRDVPCDMRDVPCDDERALDVSVAPVGRLRRFAWIASWVVIASLASLVSGHAQTGAPKPEGSAEAKPTPAPSPDPKAASSCEEYVAVLSGKKKDDALLADPKVRAFAARSFDLVACRAVATDSDAPCALIPEQESECRYLRSVLHELRTNPQGRSFMFPPAKYEMCQTDPELKPFCDRLRDAARSGNPNECGGTGDQEISCRAALTLDKSLCAEAKDPDGCKKAIEASELFGKGLKALAESGPARERALAKAALGEADACASFARAAVGSCPGPTAGPTSTARPTPAAEAAPMAPGAAPPPQ